MRGIRNNRQGIVVIKRQVCSVALLIALAAPFSASAFTDAEVDEMVKFAEGLTHLGLADYADKVLKRLGDDPRIKATKIRVLNQTGQFDEIKRLISAEADQNSDTVWVMKLTLADGLYAWGKYDEAKGYYEAFFKRYQGPIPEKVKTFYFESAYKFAQMMMLLGDLKSAASTYEKALAAQPPRESARQIMADLAEIYIRIAEEDPKKNAAILTKAEKISDDLLWVQDLWFGKAIVYKAHINILQDKTEQAMNLFDFYKQDLMAIDQVLQEQAARDGVDLSRFSPVAQCRYLLGKMLHDRALENVEKGDKSGAAKLLLGGSTESGGKMLGAMQHLVNVFIRYPTTSWAADAGRRVEAIRQTVTLDLGQEVKFSVTAQQWETVKQAQIGNARQLFNQQQYEEASDVYISILNLFPEDAMTPVALSGLAECYIEAENDMYARLVLGHVAERYGPRGDELSGPAGDILLRMAALYGERNKPDIQQEIYGRFFDNFPEHPRTPLLLVQFGDEKFAEGNFAGALAYYKRVIEIQKGRTPLYYRARLKQASCYESLGRKADQIKALQLFVKEVAGEERPGHRLLKGLYRLGEALRKLGPKYYGMAIKQYSEIVKRMEKPDDYAQGEDEAKANQSILQGASFYRAFCYSKYEAEGKDPKPYKIAALKGFLGLAKQFPESDFAPASLMQAGTLWTILEKPDEAQKVFQQLKKAYPKSSEAENVDFQLAMNLLKLGMRSRAVAVLKEMFSGSGSYSDSQILKAADELIKAEEFEIALEGYDRVLANTTTEESRAIVELAMMGRGRALLGLEKTGEGIAALESLFEKYPKTGQTVSAAMLLSEAYAREASQEQDAQKRFELFNSAVAAMNKVRQYLESGEGRAMSDVGVGRIFELKAKAEKEFGDAEKAEAYAGDAIGVYSLLVETADPADAKVQPHLEDAYHRAVGLLVEGEYWDDALRNAEQYLRHFPEGKHKLDIRRWRTVSKSKASGQVGAAGAEGTESPEG